MSEHLHHDGVTLELTDEGGRVLAGAILMTTFTQPAWYGCPNPERCEDLECTNPAHLPDRDDSTWDEAELAEEWT